MSIKSKIVTQVEEGQMEHLAKLLYPPYQTYFHQAKVAHSKQTLLSSLQQVGLNVAEFQDKSVQQIMQECEQKLKKTYTVKVVGIKDGELAVISKRFALPKKRSLKQLPAKGTLISNKDPIFSLSQQPYQIHSQFPNKQLKVVKKVKDPLDEEFKKRLLNWQAEQFERMKGKPQGEDQSDDEQPQEQQSNPSSQHQKTKKSLPRVKLQKMRRSESPKNGEDKLTENQDILFQNSNQQQKMSYSRLLNHLNDKQKTHEKTNVSPPLTNQLVVVNLNKKAPEPPKLGGVIMELDEEHENYNSDKKQIEDLATNANSGKQVTQFVLSDQDALQKRLKKIQEKLHQPEGLF